MNHRIRQVREELGLSRADFGDRIGVSGDVINNIERGRAEIKNYIIKLICCEFNVNEEWLRTGKGEPHCKKAQNDLISDFMGDLLRSEPDFRQQLVLLLARMTEDEWKILEKKALELVEGLKKSSPDSESHTPLPVIKQEDDNVIPLPITWSKASAGDGFYLYDGAEETIRVIYNEQTRKADYGVRVSGHSMEPKIHDGDIILVRDQPAVDINEIGLYTVNNCGYVKEQGPDRMISINPDYQDIRPGEYDSFRCCGKVIGVLEPEWIIDK